MKSLLRVLALAAAVALVSSDVLPQSTPNLIFGQQPTAGQWNSYFAAKQDVLGFVPLNSAGGVLSGQLIAAPSTTSLAGFNLAPGVAPTTPQNGDMWATAAGLFARLNGITVGPMVGTIASGSTAMPTSAITSGTCSSATTATATGTLTTDTVVTSFNGDPTAVTGYTAATAGALRIIIYPTADTVNFKLCNNTVSSITPGAVTMNWRVAR